MTDEILIHISNPATRQNDRLYRSLADAYLDFEPHTIHQDQSLQRQHEAPPPTAYGVDDSTGSLRGSFIGGTAGPSFLSTSKDSYGSFPSRLSSDGHAKGHVEESFVDESEDDEIPTSSRLAKLEKIHQKWRKQKTPKTSFNGRKQPAKQISSSPVYDDTTFIEDTQLGAQAFRSQLQDSFRYYSSGTDEETSEDGEGGEEDAQGPLMSSVKPAERGAPSTGRGSMLPPPKATPVPSKSTPTLSKVNLASSKAKQEPLKATLRPGSVIEARKTVGVLPPTSSKVTPTPSSAVDQRRESLRSVAASSTVVKSTPVQVAATPKPTGAITKPRVSLPAGGVSPSTIGSTAGSSKAAPKSSLAVAKPRENLHLSESPRVVETPVSTRSTAVPKSSGTIAKSRESLPSKDISTLSGPSVQHKKDVSKGVSNIETPAQPIDFSKLSVDAFPPGPKISVKQPRTLPSQVTGHLKLIKEQQPLRFQPTKKRYTPKPDERGYWVIDTLLWSPSQQKEFWTNMCESIEAGRIGWGVTMHREAGSSRALGKVRLYCWGEVVEHTWLVMWLCSRAKVNRAGLKWYDADGVAVFEMP